MMLMNKGRAVIKGLAAILHQPQLLVELPYILRGSEYAQSWQSSACEQALPSSSDDGTLARSENPLMSYFNSHKEGRGIWKWIHYFDIYQRHFSKFVGREVNVLEIGVYSGGSLEMWKEYFGSNCRVYGVDIKEACKAYEDDRTQIFVGDQADRGFWKKFKKEVPAIDIVIDDGGHLPEQQIVTLEEILPHLRHGGMYLCEDVAGDLNPYSSYVHGIARYLNAQVAKSFDREKGEVCSPTQFQTAILSIHLYPFVVVIERNDTPLDRFISPLHGTEWQPIYGWEAASDRSPLTAY